jgi:hypothetical protein
MAMTRWPRHDEKIRSSRRRASCLVGRGRTHCA